MATPNLLRLELEFAETVRPARDMIKIHKRNPDQGRRTADLSLNKGAVVFAVAAWQAYVQNLTEEILKSLAPPPSDPAAGVYKLVAARVREQIKRFNTPNSQNTLELLAAVGFDPRPGWSFEVDWERQVSKRHGSIRSRKKLTSAETAKEIDAWLLVRHRIAHGDTLPSDAERVRGVDRGRSQLTRRNADRCVRFFERLVEVTNSYFRHAARV